MLQFLLSHMLYWVIGAAVIGCCILGKYLMKRQKTHRKQKEMTLQHRRNEALNETLKNPKMKTVRKAMNGPLEIQWDGKALIKQADSESAMMIELIELCDYSRRKYLFPAGKTIRIGSGAENQLILQREGVSRRHCEIFEKSGAVAVRSAAGEKTRLVRGSITAFINEEGVFLNDGDHILLGTADIQYHLFHA